MRGWKELGLVDTIYEEEDYEFSSSSPSISPSISSPLTPLHSRVHSWSQKTGEKTDVLIYVQGTCFNLHKDPLTSRSSYLKRQLTELSEITLPLNITAEIFSLVADFCYGAQIILTPFNVVALRTAAELLGMTETSSKSGDNLKQITETYFRRVISANRELAQIVFRSCLKLLPEAETTAFLLSRCVAALDFTSDDEEMDGILDDVIGLGAEEFEIVAEAMQCRFSNHDLLYRIVDLYMQQHNSKITEEQKIEICNFIDCDKLSPQLLLHAVQNPRLPLRFIVRAMLIEQLNTRRTFFTTTASAAAANHHANTITNPITTTSTATTLGTILQRDAAKREAAQLKAEMDSTSSRIKILEKELAGMKMILEKAEKDRVLMEKKLLIDSDNNGGKSLIDSSRSASFHYGSRDCISSNKIEKGERGSSSFAGFRGSKIEDSPRMKKNSGMGLMSRLKSRLWVSKSASKCNSKS
ncbi:BTB/POZ domain-containing protein At3g49900 [Mercurialis annua]|uniref:BTB/POZ domain-containing protein At3g49900 n=1 Tax=Mercurialis annua TaxID=3986 RepID=UPI00215EC1E2|nr:BTB/POZ domain-containing protein At3g49900 [Mercurialis annua]